MKQMTCIHDEENANNTLIRNADGTYTCIACQKTFIRKEEKKEEAIMIDNYIRMIAEEIKDREKKSFDKTIKQAQYIVDLQHKSIDIIHLIDPDIDINNSLFIEVLSIIWYCQNANQYLDNSYINFFHKYYANEDRLEIYNSYVLDALSLANSNLNTESTQELQTLVSDAMKILAYPKRFTKNINNIHKAIVAIQIFLSNIIDSGTDCMIQQELSI